MKKFVIVTVAVIVTSLLLALPLTGCEGEVSFTTASLSEAAMCQSVDENKLPIDATDAFTTDTPEIFCSVKLSHAPSDTAIKAEWIYIEGELEDVSNYLIDEWSTTTDGTRYISVSITRPYNGWPRGDYKIVLYIDGKEELSTPFTVQ
jgi:hypothetical protein